VTTTATTFRSAFRLRSESDGTLTGICVPFGEVSYLTEHTGGERFVPGAFARTIVARSGKVRLKSLHSDAMPVGLASELRETDEGLHGTFRLYDTPEGRAARERARDGVYGGLSIEFRALAEHKADDGVMEVTEAALHAVALELDPAYAGAKVLAVRSATEQRAAHAWMWETATPQDLPADVEFTRYLTL
jgi:HK97 family phage prohead protease